MKKVLLLFLVLFVSLFVAVGSDRNIVYAEEYPGYAYAVLTADGDLIFFRSNDIYQDGKQTVTDIKHNEYTGTVFTGVEDGSVAHSWDEYVSKIRKIYVAEEQTFSMPDGMKFSNLSRLLSFDGSGFDTSSVTSMANMFSGCNNLTSLDLHGFDTSSVRNISYMFSNCSSLGTIDISGMDTGSVESMTGMFSGCTALESLDMSDLDLRKASSISSMFSGCNNLRSIDLSQSKVKYVENMFSGCSSLSSIDLTGIDTREVTSMYRMFYGCSSLTSIDLSSFNTGNVTNMSGMFSGCSSLSTVDLSKFDTGKVTTVSGMFNGCSSMTAIDINGLDLGNVTSMYGLFSGCSSLTALDLSGLDTRKLNSLSYIFSGCKNLRTLDMSGLDLRNVTAVENMFSGCNSLLSIDLSNSKVKNVSNMFSGCISLNSLILNGIDTSSVISMDNMFSGCSSLTSLDLSDIDSGNVTSMSYMFSGCRSLASLDLRRLNTSRVSSMAYMFSDCSCLTSVNLSGLNTNNVTDMSGMFSGCSSLKTFRLSTLSTGSVTDMSYMFSGCSSLESLDLHDVETGKVTSMSNLFSGCSSLTSLDLGGLDTGNVVNMSGMFSGCSNMTSIEFSGFDTGKAEDMSKLFYNCSSIAELDLRVFDTSRVRNMSNMFSGSSSLASLDLSSFDAYSVTNMNDMFIPCDNLGKVVIGAWFDKWDSPLPGDDQWGHDGLLKTPAEIAEGFSTHASEWAGTWERIRTYAVLSEEGDLVFLKSKQSVKNGTTSQIEDLSGNSYSGTVFTYPSSISDWRYTSDIPWYAKRNNIKSVSVANGNTIKPIYIDNWFQGCSSLESFDCTGFDPSNITVSSELFNGCNSLMRIVMGPLFTKGNITIPGDDPWENKGIKKTSKELAAEYPSHITEWTGLWERIRTYAVLTKTGDLVFLNSKHTYKSDNRIEDIKGNSYQGTVYSYVKGISEWKAVAGTSWDLPEMLVMGSNDSDVPWSAEKDRVKRVYVANGSTIKPVYFYWWFADCHSLKTFDGSGFDTSNVTDMSGLFYDCSSLESFDGSGFDTNIVADMSDMFSGCYSLMRVVVSPYTTWNALLPGDDTWEHNGIRKTPQQLAAGFKTHAAEWAGTWERIRTYAVLTKTGDLVFLNSKEFHNNKTEAQVKDINGKKYTGTVYSYVNGISEWGNLENMPQAGVPWDSIRSKVKNVFVSAGSIIRPSHMYGWFKDFTSLKSFDASGFDTSNVYNMAYLFNGCSNLTTLDLSNFETSNAAYMYGMFTGCRSLLSLDIRGFDTGSDIYLDDCVNLLSITLGKKINTDFWLPPKDLNPGYYWTNGDLIKTSSVLDREYQNHASEWAGTWKRVLYPVTKTTATNYGNGILVKWDQVELEPGNTKYGMPSGYVIYRRAMKSGTTEWTTFARWNNTTEFSFLDTNVYEGTKYQYGIKAYYGNDPSTTKWLGPVGPMSTALVYSKKPSAPTVTTSKNTDNGIEISWDKVKGASGYVIYRRAWSSSTGGWTEFQRWNNTTSTTWIDTKVYAGTRYQYGIKAYYGDDPKDMAYVGSVGPLSTNVRITTRKINNVKVINHGGGYNTVSVYYDESSLFTGYQIQYITLNNDPERTSSVKTITVSDPKTTSASFDLDYTVNECWIKVRSYYIFNGVTYYGAWSEEEKVW